jgi:uncharacterized protein (DUF2344 family)
MENNQKSIIGPIVIIIVILALGSGFYYYSKNQKVNKLEEQTPVNVITDNTSNASNTPNTLNKTSNPDSVKDNTQVQNAINVNQDSQLKAMILNLRQSSELYYDSHMSYTDMCKASGTAFSKTLNGVKEKVGSEAKCYDGKDYAVSVKLTTGEFYCVDSTGFTGKTSKPASSSVCPQ